MATEFEGTQYLRKASLFLLAGQSSEAEGSPSGKAIDLSQFRFTFKTAQEDVESPNNCAIRVYNLSPGTVHKVKAEYQRVVLQAGYENANFGVIFDGTIKQFREGRENNTTTYLDILAADGDMAYNFAYVSKSLAAGANQKQVVEAINTEMTKKRVELGHLPETLETGGVLPRGKVLFGLARARMRTVTRTIGATWDISNGKLNITPLDGYLPGEAVVLTSGTGLIGRVEQTQDGMVAKCLINPKIVVGGLVKINNKSINQTSQAPGSAIPGAQLAYNAYAGIQMFANVSADGLYRVYVAEHRGDTRGQDWYTELVCLSVDAVTGKVKPYG